MNDNLKDKAIKMYISHIIEMAEREVYMNYGVEQLGETVSSKKIIEWINNMDSGILLNIFYPVLANDQR